MWNRDSAERRRRTCGTFVAQRETNKFVRVTQAGDLLLTHVRGVVYNQSHASWYDDVDEPEMQSRPLHSQNVVVERHIAQQARHTGARTPSRSLCQETRRKRTVHTDTNIHLARSLALSAYSPRSRPSCRRRPLLLRGLPPRDDDEARHLTITRRPRRQSGSESSIRSDTSRTPWRSGRGTPAGATFAPRASADREFLSKTW